MPRAAPPIPAAAAAGHRWPSQQLAWPWRWGGLTAGQAQAFVVTVGGQAWDVTTFTGTYNANTSKFASPPTPGVMPWWNSGSLSDAFARAVGDSLGLPNSGQEGPFFAVALSSGNVISMRLYTYLSNYIYDYSYNTSTSATKTWAQATQYTPPAPVPVRVPGPLPALGAAAAFGFSRQLRKRIKRSANAISST